MKHIRTQAWMPYPPEQVWGVLTDFGAFAEWNPLTVWAEGAARRGAHVRMRFVDAGGRGKIIAQTVTVTACEPPRRLEWVGRIPVLFTGRHFFLLEHERDGTRITHGEELSGLVPMFFSTARLERQEAAYRAMNGALERRVAVLRR